MSLVNGTVVDQTNTSIGISFVGGTTGATTTAIPPIIRYIPELAGWFAIEYNSNAVAVPSITYQPKVYFRPDSTQVWGQIGTLPSSYKGYYTYITSDHLLTRLIYWNSKLYLFGLTKTGEVRSSFSDLSKYVLVSEDGGVTWADIKVSDSISIRLESFSNIMSCSLDKNKPNAGIFRVSSNSSSPQFETDVNLDTANLMIVETNNSAASPTTTTVYTRIA